MTATINVETIDPSNRGGPYFCRYCGAVMVPRLGEVLLRHFAHAKDADWDRCLERQREAAKFVSRAMSRGLSFRGGPRP